MRTRLLLWMPLACVLVAMGGPAVAAPPALTVPDGGALTLDGRLDEEAWATAAVLPVASVEVPRLTPEGRTQVAITPAVRVLASKGSLVLGVDVPEAAGGATGLHVFVAPPGAATAADAWSITYRPFEPRVAAITIRGPGGVGAGALAVDAKVDASAPDRWTLELVISAAALVGAGESSSSAPRLACAVLTRTPSVVAFAPADAGWVGPEAWASLAVPEQLTAAPWTLDAERTETAADLNNKCAIAWTAFLEALTTLPPEGGSPVETLFTASLGMLQPLDVIQSMRPDVQPTLDTLRGDVLERLGDLDRAAEAYKRALATAPGWHEARFGLGVRITARRHLDQPPAEPVVFDALVASIEATRANHPQDLWVGNGCDLAQALVALYRGDFGKAVSMLDVLEARFPSDAWIVDRAAIARVEQAQEPLLLRRRKPDTRETLPLIKVVTNRGELTFVLFEDEAPNAVRQVVWLADEGAYAKTTWHHHVPMRWLVGGDPLSRDPATRARAGTGTQGYAIPFEQTERRFRRGTLALVRRDEDEVGGTLLLATGTAVDAASDTVIVGRVIEGEEVLDLLRRGDAIERIEVLRRRPGSVYRPMAVDGNPAPKPQGR